jgi:hypothetical protein
MGARLVRSRRGVVLIAAAVLLWSHAATGEDSPAGSKVKPRFIDRGEYVEDSQSGLLWQKDGSASGKKNFYEAAEYAEKLKLGGLTGWRVPTAKELQTIFPAADAPFTNTGYRKERYAPGLGEFRSYWTSDLDKRLEDYAYIYQWYADGGANNGFASKNYVFVRCVRDRADAKLADAIKPEPLDEKTAKRVKELIAQLGDENFQKRDAAEKGLAEMGRKIVPLLTEALEKTTDPEVEFRLAKLLETVD